MSMTLRRTLRWWAAYALVSAGIALLWGVPPRVSGGYGLLEAMASTAASWAPMLSLDLVPAFAVLAAWALLAERNPEWDAGDVRLVATSALLGAFIAAGQALLAVNPGFAWRTGSYAGDAAQGTAALFMAAWLSVLFARLLVRGLERQTAAGMRSIA